MLPDSAISTGVCEKKSKLTNNQNVVLNVLFIHLHRCTLILILNVMVKIVIKACVKKSFESRTTETCDFNLCF